MTYTAHEVISGVYEKTVKMTVDRRLQYAPYAQAGWRNRKTVGGTAALNCSRTTSRQFTLAMRECGLSDSVTRALKSALSGGDMAVLVCGKWILHSTGEVIA